MEGSLRLAMPASMAALPGLASVPPLWAWKPPRMAVGIGWYRPLGECTRLETPLCMVASREFL
jgi:hypothetical protein